MHLGGSVVSSRVMMTTTRTAMTLHRLQRVQRWVCLGGWSWGVGLTRFQANGRKMDVDSSEDEKPLAKDRASLGRSNGNGTASKARRPVKEESSDLSSSEDEKPLARARKAPASRSASARKPKPEPESSSEDEKPLARKRAAPAKAVKAKAESKSKVDSKAAVKKAATKKQ